MTRKIFSIFSSLIAAAYSAPKPMLALIATASLANVAPTHAKDFDHSHAAFTKILETNVDNGRVDYEAIKRAPEPLSSYLDTLASVTENEYNDWSEKRRLAFLINLYNAATIKLVVDNYPVKSIKRIGGFLKGPWDQRVVPLFGERVTLNHIEHDRIRARFNEPRVHFALVCASIGCPPLRAEAFTADELESQLDDQGRTFMANIKKNRVDAASGSLYLSPVFKWFKEDFTQQAGSVERFVAPYLPSEADREAALSGKLKVRYTDYDWSLNSQ